MTSNHYRNHEKCHYETLGVSKDATIEEIKKQFRILSLKTHPDLNNHKNNANSSNNNNKNVANLVDSNAEQFKRISNAASILTNPKLKQKYDYERFQSNSSYYTAQNSAGMSSHNFHKGSRSSSSSHANYYNSSSTPFIIQLMRPRNLILGPILFCVGVSTIQYIFNIVDPYSMEANRKQFLSSTSDGNTNQSITQQEVSHAEKVLAWKNPISNQYETPAPWDPVYQQVQPELQYVPRHKVIPRSPGVR